MERRTLLPRRMQVGFRVLLQLAAGKGRRGFFRAGLLHRVCHPLEPAHLWQCSALHHKGGSLQLASMMWCLYSHRHNPLLLEAKRLPASHTLLAAVPLHS